MKKHCIPHKLRSLNDETRSRLPGSFVRLTRGFVHYELSGPEDGPVVVLVGGFSVPYSTWDRSAPALAASGFRVLRYDHYGRGYSDRPRIGYGLDLFVEQLSELVDGLGLSRPLGLVGLSMGGPVVAAAASRYSGLVSSLAFVDPLFEWPTPVGTSRFLLLPCLGDALMALYGREILAQAQRGDFSKEDEFAAFLPSYLPQFAYRGIGRAVLQTMRGMPSWPLTETFSVLGRSDIPTLLFWGRLDATLPFEQSSRLRVCVPQAEFIPVEDAGHVPHWEKAVEVNAALIDFFRCPNKNGPSFDSNRI
jgi:pimeloyl-ACP methyl ester carboxylesterase